MEKEKKKLKERCLGCWNWTGCSCKEGLNSFMAINWDKELECKKEDHDEKL